MGKRKIIAALAIVFAVSLATGLFAGTMTRAGEGGSPYYLYFGTAGSGGKPDFISGYGPGLVPSVNEEEGYTSFSLAGASGSVESYFYAALNATALKNVTPKEYPYLAVRCRTNLEGLYYSFRLHTETDSSNYLLWKGNQGTSTPVSERTVPVGEWVTLYLDVSKTLFINEKAEDSFGGAYRRLSFILGSTNGNGDAKVTHANADSYFDVESFAFFDKDSEAAWRAFDGLGDGKADYTKGDEAIATAEGYLTQTDTYTQASLWALQAQVDNVVRDRHISEQADVDEYAAGILAAVSALKPKRTDTPAGFDETDVVLRAGMMSDVHIGLNYGAEYFTKALKILNRQVGSNKLDMMLFGGDLADQTFLSGLNNQILEFKTLLEAQIDPDETAVFYTLGNHDIFDNYKATTGKTTKELIAMYSDAFREGTDFSNRYFKYDQDKSVIPDGNRHAIYGGYHFLSVNFETNCSSTQASLNWLDAKLAAITAENPNQYVFVLTHAPAYDTVWGSAVDVGDRNYNGNLDSVLKKYPQVVCLSGHIHNDLNKETTIMQGNYTSVDLGCTNYAAAMTAAELINGGSQAVKPQGLADTKQYSQFCYMEIDGSGNIRITRIDSYHDRIIGTWDLSAPDEDKYFLEDYTKYRYYGIEAPAFEEGAELNFIQSSYSTGTLSFPTPKGDGLLQYKISIERVSDGKIIEELRYSTNTFWYGRDYMPETFSIDLSAIELDPAEEYLFKVSSLTEWMTEGANSLTCRYRPSGEFAKKTYHIDLTKEESYSFGYANKVQLSQTDKGVEVSMATGRTTDPYFYLDVARFGVPAGQNVFAAFRIDTNLAGSNCLQFRFLSTTSDSLSAWWNAGYTGQASAQTVVCNLSTPTGGSAVEMLKGNLTQLRIDLCKDGSNDYVDWTEDTYFHIESIAFFMTEADARAYAGIDSAPPEAEVTGITYSGSLVEGAVLDGSKLTAQTETPGHFRFADESVKFGTDEYVWVFVPDDLENYRVTLGKVSLTSERDPDKRYAGYVDMTDPGNSRYYGDKVKIILTTEGGVTKTEFDSLSVVDPSFSVDISNLGLNMGEFPVVMFRVRTNIENLKSEIRFTTSNKHDWWAWISKDVAGSEEWITLVYDLRTAQGYTSDYADGDYVRIRFDWYNSSGDVLNLQEGDYFEFDSMGVFTDTASAAAYTGISSVKPSVTGISYTGSLSAGAVLDASKLTAQTSVSGTFTFAETDIAEGAHDYHWTFTPDDINMLAVSGTISLTGVGKTTPEIGAPTYSGSLLEGDELDGTKLTGNTSVPGRFVFEETALIAGTHLYHWTFIPEDEETYLEVTGTIELTAKLRPSVSGVSYAGNAVAGEAPDASKLLAATDIEGTFRIVETVFVEGSATYHWIFTPTDENYGEVTGTLEITAQAAEQEPEKTGCGCGGIGLGWAGFGGLGGVLILTSALFRRKKEVME